MNRRDFLRRLTATAAGILVADSALELEPRRQLWPGWSPAEPVRLVKVMGELEVDGDVLAKIAGDPGAFAARVRREFPLMRERLRLEHYRMFA